MWVTVRFNHWLPKFISKFFDISAITIGHTIYLPGEDLSETLFRHEVQHVYQIEADGWFKYYFFYAAFFIMHFLKMWNWEKAYQANQYERDAYAVQNTPLTETERNLYQYYVSQVKKS